MVDQSLQLLDRHNIDCGSGRALQQWALGGCSGNNRQFQYRRAFPPRAPPRTRLPRPPEPFRVAAVAYGIRGREP